MKKLVLMFAAALLAVSASAQTVSESKSSDNFYLGVNGGVITATHPSTMGQPTIAGFVISLPMPVCAWAAGLLPYSVWLLRGMPISRTCIMVISRVRSSTA